MSHFLMTISTDTLSLSPDNTATQHTGILSAGPMTFWVGTPGSPYLHVLCQPLENSFQTKEDFIKVLNGHILVTVNKKILNKKLSCCTKTCLLSLDQIY